MNRHFQGLMNGATRFPGLPSVALGYGWVARFAGCNCDSVRRGPPLPQGGG